MLFDTMRHAARGLAGPAGSGISVADHAQLVDEARVLADAELEAKKNDLLAKR